MNGRLEGKRAIVIGSATGIGAATARRFAAEGARVVVADIAEETAAEVAKSIGRDGGEATSYGMDLGSDDSVRALIEDTVQRLGGLDILHNNAAALTAEVAGRDLLVPIGEVPDEVWDRTMQVNLRGFWVSTKIALPHMIAGGGGSIINTSSTAAMTPLTTSGAYAISKGAIMTLTKVTATHYGRQGIRCNAICPGFIDTGTMQEEYIAMGVRHCLVPRVGIPDDIASMATFLASDDASYVTGQIMTVDGGLLTHVPTYAELTPDRIENMSTRS
jgi:NAD(P)-dependent dehydrogenase (short-subunit alcohol dehydrogenase family)